MNMSACNCAQTPFTMWRLQSRWVCKRPWYSVIGIRYIPIREDQLTAGPLWFCGGSGGGQINEAWRASRWQGWRHGWWSAWRDVQKSVSPYNAGDFFRQQFLWFVNTYFYIMLGMQLSTSKTHCIQKRRPDVDPGLENWPLPGPVSPRRSILRSELPRPGLSPLSPERAAAAHPRWDANLMLKGVEVRIPKYILPVIFDIYSSFKRKYHP